MLWECLHQCPECRLFSRPAHSALHSGSFTRYAFVFCCFSAVMVVAIDKKMDGSNQDGKSDTNRVKYYLAFMKCSRECLEDAFSMLYATWARGRSYATLREFCVDCLGLRKEQLSQILCQPEIVPPQDSARSSKTLPSGVKVINRKTLGEEIRGSQYASRSSLMSSKSFSRLIRRSVRRNQSELTNARQDVKHTVSPLRKLSLGEDQDHRGHVVFNLRMAVTQNTSEASCDGDLGVSRDEPRPQDTITGAPKAANGSFLWGLVRQHLLSKSFENETHYLSLGQGSVDHAASSLPPSPSSSPTLIRETPLGHQGQTQPQVLSEDSRSLKTDDSQNINVIREVNYNLKHLLFFHDSRQESCCLDLKPDPRQMSLSVLVTLITKVFPEVTPEIQQLVNRLQHLVYAVCYQDLVFDDHQLKFRLQNMSLVISKLVATVANSCKVVTQKIIMEISEKLRASKQQLRSVQEEYRNHLYWVDKTRGEFVFVQKELRKVKARSSQICQAHSRSCSPESDDTQEATVMRKRKESRNTLANGDSRIDDNISCRLDLLLSEGLKGQEARTDRKDNDDSDNYSDSLLASVMREVALIEEKHNSLISFNRRLKKRSRGFHKSVIITKRERLNYDVSAEDSAMSKEENLRSRHMKTNMLSKEVRKLKRNLKNLQIDEKVITSRINHDLEAVREDEVLEEALRKGRLGVQQLREESGRLLLESRQEAKRFASRVRILDLGEWLLRRTYVTTPVGQVYSRLRGADTSDSVHIADLIDPNGQQPPIIVLSGPKGSGKTCMAHYLLQQWESNTEAIKSNIHKFDLVVYGTVGNILSSGTWAQYLREHIFYLTLVDFPEVEIFGALNTMSVLYLLDLDTTTPSISKILDDVFGNVGNNHVVLTTRPDGEDPIARAAKRHNIKYQRVRMCPMTSNAIQEYSTNLLSLVEQDDSVVSNKVKQFSRFVSSMKTTDEVLYPLPLAYLLHLWRANPRHAQQATTVSRLIYHVIFEAESSFLGSLLATDSKDKAAARIRVEQCTKRLYEAAWEVISGHGWPLDAQISLESENIGLIDPVEITYFSTFTIVKESADGKLQASLLHPCLAEILCGFFLTQQRLHKGSSILQRREKLEKYCVPEIKRYKEVLPHAAASLVYNKHKLEDAKEIATLFSSSLSDKRDMIAWNTLLKECDFLQSMCRGVSSLLSCYDSWTVANHSQETNCAVADLLKREAYQPQTVIISQEEKFCCNSQCVIRALATCSSTFVHLRQDSKFYAWGKTETSDALIMPLQPPGTLQEFWGHLGVEGGLALRHFHHLVELNVRVSSCEALKSLVYSIGYIRRSLQYLYLRLDLPASTPVSDIEPLKFKGKNLWLRIRGVEDENLNWVKEITAKLSDWYTEVLLEKSSLSPLALHELKQSLPNTPVHISV